MTLSEITVTLAISTLIAGAAVTSLIGLNRAHRGAEHYAELQSAQTRVVDFLDTDLRRAREVIPGDGVISLLLPGVYDPDGNVRMPTANGRMAEYGTESEQVTVTYRISNGVLRRIETRPNAEFETVIATNLDDFAVDIFPHRNLVATRATFTPRFRFTNAAANRERTSLTTTTYMRNLRTSLSEGAE